MKESVCGIIVTYNIGKDLLRCFSSIEGQVEEVIIVDNGSDTETISVLGNLEKTCNNVKVLYNKENLGIAAAQNIGVKYAIDKGYMWILTLDHDSEATTHMVENLLNAYRILSNQHINNIGIIAAKPLDKTVQTFAPEGKPFNKGSEIEEVDRVISSGSLINTRVFETVGFFNESLFLYYVDDDFCLRCKNNDWRIYVYRSAVLIHREGIKEIKKFLWKKYIHDNYSFHARYYISRNAIYMLKKYFKYHRYRSCYWVIKRMFKDTTQIILFENSKTELIYYSIKGIFDGITGKYGKLIIGDNKR